MRRILTLSILLVAELHVDAGGRRPANCRFANSITRFRVERAVTGALRRLESPSCQRVFSDFVDGNGASLQLALDRSGATAQDFAAALHFVDGTDTPQCTSRRELAAYTSPGNRVIFVCGDRFKVQFDVGSKAAEMLIIHEVLHAAGLRENPPSSEEITTRVTRRCGA